MSRHLEKNIGFFDSYKVWGGGEKWHDEVSRYVSAHRHNVTVFTPKDGQLHRRLLGKVRLVDIQVEKLSYLNPVEQINYFKRLKKYKLDALIFNSFVDVRAAAYAAKKAGVKRTILRVGTPIAPKEKKSYLYAFKHGLDEIVGISNENIDCFYRDAPRLIENKKTQIIPNAIDLKLFEKKDTNKNEVPTFGNCCRLTDQKGLNLLLEAIKALKEKRGNNFRVLIAGEGEDKEKLVDYCQQNNLSMVEFVGHIENTSDFYNELDFLVFTSKFEGTARTILEAYACELPVLAFKASSMKEMIINGETGFFVKPFEVADLIEKIEKLLDSPKKWSEMGRAGRKFVECHHDKEVVYKRWLDYFTLGIA